MKNVRHPLVGIVACVALVAASLVAALAVDTQPANANPAFVGYPLSAPGGGAQPITVGSDGNFWFTEAGANAIAKGTPSGVITEFTVPTADSTVFGIAAGADGNLWFTERDANKIGRITTAGVITEFTIPTTAAQPFVIAPGSDGNLWFTESGANQIGRITTAGVITEFPIPTDSTGPVGIAPGPDGNLWFTEGGAPNVGRITTAGVITEFPVPAGHNSNMISAGPDGNLWATSPGTDTIMRITPAGAMTDFPIASAATSPNFITGGPDGNVWYSLAANGLRIGMITPDGDATEFDFYGHGLPGGLVGGPDGNVWISTQTQLVKAKLILDPSGEFTSLTPARLLDTRPGFTTVDHVHEGGGAVGNNSSIDVQITGRGGVPATGQVSAVVMNATVTGPNLGSYLTVWPTGVTRPTISNLNYGPGQTVPNLVTVAVGTGGKVSVYNNQGSAHVILDVVGYYSTDTGPLGSRFHGFTPVRFFDTRFGSPFLGVPAAKVGPGGTLKVNVVGKGGVPGPQFSAVTAVVMNVTITEPTGGSFLTVFPDDVSRPNASNLNFSPGQTVPNLVTVRVPESGIVDFYNAVGATHVIADVVGYYDDVKTTEAGRFIAMTPFRRADTRVISPFPAPGKVPPNSVVAIRYPGFFGIPSTGVGSIVMNVTVTEPDAPSFLTVYPSDSSSRPNASNLNFGPGQTVPNQVISRVSVFATPGLPPTTGWISYYNALGFTHVIVDVFGYFLDDSVLPTEAGAAGALASGPDIAAVPVR